MNAPRAVPRIDRPSRSDFERLYLEPELPVVITGVVSRWRAFECWEPGYLERALGDAEVDVNESSDGDYFDAAGVYGERPTVKMPWRRFIREVFGPAQKVLYLRQQAIANFAPLDRDIEMPEYMPRPVYILNLWIGAAPATTVLHYDSEDNFLVQVRGRKRVRLYPADEIERMYPYPARSSSFNSSRLNQVDIDQYDRAKFPLFEGASAWECELGPGDMLYIPIHWWHHVRTLESGVSVNFWWPPRPDQARRYPGRRFLPTALRAGHAVHTLSTMLPRPLGNALTGAERAARALKRRLQGVA